MARDAERCLGGAVIAHNAPGIALLANRHDLCALWDIRVLPVARRSGIGTALFNASVEWATERHCGHLIIETQNVNVAACRFYAKQGCSLIQIDKSAYDTFPDEIKLIWQKTLL